MDNKKILTVIISIFIVVIFGIVIWGSKNKKTDSSQAVVVELNTPVFFYGNACPLCADVEAWLKEKKIEEKIKITKKEVYDNRRNAQELNQVAQKCGLPTDSIGVPFLFAEGKCLIGTPDIINYLSKKAGIIEVSNPVERTIE